MYTMTIRRYRSKYGRYYYITHLWSKPYFVVNFAERHLKINAETGYCKYTGPYVVLDAEHIMLV